jgi:hypothetical protein
VFRISFKIVRAGGTLVDNANAAVAAASCVSCETVAIAIQVVLVTGDPSVFTPTNLALALNVGCSGCQTLASAYQYVLQTDGAVHFSADGNKELAAVRRALARLRVSDLSIWEIQARLDELSAQIAQVLSTELRSPAG